MFSANRNSDPLTWPTLKISYTSLKMRFFKQKNFSHPFERNQLFTWGKNFFYLPKNNKYLMITGRNSFPNKKFFILVWKTNSLYLCIKVKVLLNWVLLFFILANIGQSLFVKHFIFPYFLIFFSSSFCFSSFERFL